MKRTSFIISFALLLLFIQRSEAANDGVLLKDVPSSSLLAQLPLQSKEYLNTIILLPHTPFNEREAGEMIKRIDRIPSSILKKMAIKKIKIRLFDGKLTDLPTARHLKGVTPRGYTNTSTTWDDVPGAGGSDVVMIKIGHSEKGKGHGSVNLELHELAHTLDKMVFQGIRYDQTFKHIWKLEASKVFGNHAYFLRYPEEYFAETFAMYYANEESHFLLKTLAPKTYEYIQQLK